MGALRDPNRENRESRGIGGAPPFGCVGWTRENGDRDVPTACPAGLAAPSVRSAELLEGSEPFGPVLDAGILAHGPDLLAGLMEHETGGVHEAVDQDPTLRHEGRGSLWVGSIPA